MKRYAKGWKKGLTRFKRMGRASFRKGGCISTVRLCHDHPHSSWSNLEIVVLIRFQMKGISHL